MLGTLVTKGWFPVGCIPIVGSAPGKSGVPLSGFVSIKSGETFITSPERFTWESTIAAIRSFLKNYKCKRGHKIYMILDNAPWHKKAKRLIRDENNDEYADIRAKVIFLDIPPYSPDLNPIEQLWRKARYCFLQPPFGKSCKVKMENCASPKWRMLQTGSPASYDTGKIPLQTGYQCYK